MLGVRGGAGSATSSGVVEVHRRRRGALLVHRAFSTAGGRLGVEVEDRSRVAGSFCFAGVAAANCHFGCHVVERASCDCIVPGARSFL